MKYQNKIIQSPILLEKPFVSIVIPSFNRVESVSETIQSILNQICNFSFEIVIGDDFSTDNVRNLLRKFQKKYPDKFVLIFHNENIGLGANWATCVKHCRGKYIANCDNDDYWHNPKKLQLQVDFMETHSKYGVSHTDYRNHNRVTNKFAEVIISNYTYDNQIYKTIFNGGFRCCNATVMYRKELIDKYIHLDDYINYQFTLQDWNTWIILSHYTEFYCLPVSTATFGIETDSITRPVSYEKTEYRFKKEKECYRYICDCFPKDFIFDEQLYDVYVNCILLSLAYKKGDYKIAHKYGSLMIPNERRNLKINCSQNALSFHLLWVCIKIKSIITSLYLISN